MATLKSMSSNQSVITFGAESLLSNFKPARHPLSLIREKHETCRQESQQFLLLLANAVFYTESAFCKPPSYSQTMRAASLSVTRVNSSDNTPSTASRPAQSSPKRHVPRTRNRRAKLTSLPVLTAQKQPAESKAPSASALADLRRFALLQSSDSSVSPYCIKRIDNVFKALQPPVFTFTDHESPPSAKPM